MQKYIFKVSYREEQQMAIIDVVKYNGEPNVFAWKYPNEEMGT